ncbi:MAG: ABC transporter permease [Candidatus Bathyarchaeota archaeon]|nr:MAG: ABC transporter permease [Candidatus Bathyarchaeota archaeon]
MKDDPTFMEQVLNFFRGEKKSVLLNLSPSLLWYGIFLAAPLVVVVMLSFWQMEDVILIPTFTLEHYYTFFTRPVYIRVLLRSLGIATAVTAGAIALGYPAAYYLSFKTKIPKYTLLIVLMGPYLASYLIIIFSLKFIILGYGGLVNTILMDLGLIAEPIAWFVNNQYAVIFTLVQAWTPWIILPMFASLEKIDKALLEAAADLGASPMLAFRKVTLPLSMPGILVAVLFVFIPSVGEFLTADLMGGTSGFMVGNIIQKLFERGLHWPRGSAITIMMMIVTLTIILILLTKVSLEQIMESL